MKRLPLFPLFAAVLLFAGCDSVRERFSPPVEPHVRTYPADPKATYAAARAALDKMGFRFVHGGPAAGTLTAVSDVSTGETMASARQFTLKAEFTDAPGGDGTQVSVRMTEVVESGPEHERPLATETSLRGTSLYEVFFRLIQQGLGAPVQKPG
jgi:hypothetical protein